MIRVAARANPDVKKLQPEHFEKDIFVFSAGYQRFISKDYHISRPSGRQDYQLLYIYKGCGIFQINGKQTRLEAGNLVLYEPGDPQIYTYHADEAPEIYWIHFLGTHTKELLGDFHSGIYYIGVSRTMKKIFDEIILELQLRRPQFQTLCVANLLKLLVHSKRLAADTHKAAVTNPQLDKFLAHLNRHYMESWSIQQMANYCNMSIDYFSHQFKLLVGVSPIRFLNDLRISHAKEILLTESLSISEVAKLVGYSNPLYFSRAFKKSTGTSPSTYTINQM